jgi:ESS family glutamate:Na+ symporter
MTADQIGFALIYLGIFLFVSKWIRVRTKWLQSLFIPSSVIAGFFALLLGPQVLGNILGQFVGEDSFWNNGIIPEATFDVWAELPGLMINVVFATLFLGVAIPGVKRLWNIGGPQFAFGWTIGWGQYVVGIILAILVLGPLFGMPPVAGTLIEIAFEGGHGTAAGLQGTFEEIGFPEGYDLSIGLATVGLLTGVITGIILINWAVRRGKTKVIQDTKGFSSLRRQGIVEFENREPAAKMTVRPESIEPLSFHFAIVGIAILIGFAILEGLIWLESVLTADSEFMTYIPLFPLAMIGGIILQIFISKIDKQEIVDRNMMNRIQGLALDILILSAIGTVSIDVIGDNLIPFLLLAAVGIIWNIIGFLILAPRFIPTYWFERGIGDFGQSMGVTATGLLLMRAADPDNKSPAFEAFGYKQLAYEPFLGGGLVTALSVPLIFQFGPIPFLIFSIIMCLIGLFAGLFYFGKMKA